MRVSESQMQSLLELLTALEQSLYAETAALRARDADALNDAVASKRAALRAVTVALKDSGLASLLQGSTGAIDDELSRSASWQAIVKKLRSCRELNESAGGAIAGLIKTTRNALELVGLPGSAPAYSTTGHSPASLPDRRTLAIC